MNCIMNTVSKCKGKKVKRKVLTRDFCICKKHNDGHQATEWYLLDRAKYGRV